MAELATKLIDAALPCAPASQSWKSELLSEIPQRLTRPSCQNPRPTVRIAHSEKNLLSSRDAGLNRGRVPVKFSRHWLGQTRSNVSFRRACVT